MQYILKDDLEAIAIGGAVLGSGGGGSPTYNLRIASHLMGNAPIRLLSMEELSEDALVVPIAFMGAPIVALEKLPSGKEFEKLFSMLKKEYGQRNYVLMPAEIGGGNCLTALIAAAILDLPVLDADSIGRAFPELQMSSMTLHNISSAPAFFADALGNGSSIHANEPKTLERLARQLAIGMGSRALCALYLMSGSEAKKAAIAGSLSLAKKIGRIILSKRNPIDALIDEVQLRLIGTGKVIDVDYAIEKGFLNGVCTIKEEDGSSIKLLYQNEFLFAKKEELFLGKTPEILTLIEHDTGNPITSADLSYGLFVHLIAIEAPPIWSSSEGLSLVGPEQFKHLLKD